LRARDEQSAKNWIKEIKIHIEEANRLRAGEGSPTDLVKDTKFWKVSSSPPNCCSSMLYQNSSSSKYPTQETSYSLNADSLEVQSHELSLNQILVRLNITLRFI
jgi:hypothetical protein